MLSKSKIKQITKLHSKKERLSSGMFIAEGVKIVDELIETYSNGIVEIYATSEWCNNFNHSKKFNLNIISEEELKKISTQNNPNNVLVIAKQLKSNKIEFENNKPIIVIDEIKDPGNLGTIIRTMDWFGLKNLVCSDNSVDIYNPKVIQSSMGSFLRINLKYCEIESFIIEQKNKKNCTVYGTFMEGENVNKIKFDNNSIIIFGNESRGISNEIEQIVDKKISISKHSNSKYPESLNLSVSFGIICNLI